jgi:hypothetical protein
MPSISWGDSMGRSLTISVNQHYTDRKRTKRQFNAPVSFYLFLNALQHFGSDFTVLPLIWFGEHKATSIVVLVYNASQSRI